MAVKNKEAHQIVEKMNTVKMCIIGCHKMIKFYKNAIKSENKALHKSSDIEKAKIGLHILAFKCELKNNIEHLHSLEFQLKYLKERFNSAQVRYNFEMYRKGKI